jgi:hypothetical protein
MVRSDRQDYRNAGRLNRVFVDVLFVRYAFPLEADRIIAFGNIMTIMTYMTISFRRAR